MLDYFDPIKCFVQDVMHVVYEGILNLVVSLFLQSPMSDTTILLDLDEVNYKICTSVGSIFSMISSSVRPNFFDSFFSIRSLKRRIVSDGPVFYVDYQHQTFWICFFSLADVIASENDIYLVMEDSETLSLNFDSSRFITVLQ